MERYEVSWDFLHHQKINQKYQITYQWKRLSEAVFKPLKVIRAKIATRDQPYFNFIPLQLFDDINIQYKKYQKIYGWKRHTEAVHLSYYKVCCAYEVQGSSQIEHRIFKFILLLVITRHEFIQVFQKSGIYVWNQLFNHNF